MKHLVLCLACLACAAPVAASAQEAPSWEAPPQPSGQAPAPTAEQDDAPRAEGPFWLKSGLALPYPLDNVFRGFSNCRRGRHKHQALDIGGVGEDWGLGTPVYAMARARVIYLGTPEEDPARYGQRLTEPARVERGKKSLPTSGEVPGYGKVWFFTQSHGRARTGVFLALKVMEGRLKGYTLEYMHLAAVRPDLKVGDVVEAGQEVGLMGGTAVQSDAPHLHLAIKNRGGRNLDVGPLLGIGKTIAPCRSGKGGERQRRDAYSRGARKLMHQLRGQRQQRHAQRPLPASCGIYEVEAVADQGGVLTWELPALPQGPARATWTIEVLRQEGRWQPWLGLEDEHGQPLFGGARPARGGRSWKPRAKAHGKKGDKARVQVTVPAGRGLRVLLDAWGRGQGLPEGARLTLRLERPCPD